MQTPELTTVQVNLVELDKFLESRNIDLINFHHELFFRFFQNNLLSDFVPQLSEIMLQKLTMRENIEIGLTLDSRSVEYFPEKEDLGLFYSILNAAIKKTNFTENLQPFTFKAELNNFWLTERFLASVSLVSIEAQVLCKNKAGKVTSVIKSDKLKLIESYRTVKTNNEEKPEVTVIFSEWIRVITIKNILDRGLFYLATSPRRLNF
jgi:hypothetical protein